MESWLSFVSIVASFVTFIGFIAVFVKLGREKGETDANMKEMKERIIRNEKKLDELDNEFTQKEVENARIMGSISNDLSWIKNSLIDIKSELSKKG